MRRWEPSVRLAMLALIFALAGNLGKCLKADEPAADAAASKQVALSNKELYKALLPSVCWLRTAGPSDDPGNCIGTGFVVDVDRKLVVTNEHVVKGFSPRGYDELFVHFPEYDANGKLIVDPTHYRNQADALRGEVIHRDASRDLALLKLPALPDGVKAVTLAEELPEPGEPLLSIAGLPEGSEGLWIMTVGSVRMAYRRSHANGAVAGVVETDMPTNRGNSGGPIVNNRNELVAVCEGARTDARLVSMMIDVKEVRQFLEVCESMIDPQTALDFYNRGVERHDADRWELALVDYARALKLDPQMSMAAVNRGWIFTLMDDHATAEAEFDAAIKIDPENASAYEGRGVCRRELGKLDAALADFTQAIRREPDEAHLYFRRAKAHRKNNDLAAALADLDRCVALDSQTADNFGERGQVHRALKNYDKAFADFDAASKLEPRNAIWYYEAAHVFYEQEQYPPAVQLNSIAIQLDNTQPYFYNDRGLAYYQQEKYAEALADFQQALQLNPKSSRYAEKVGDCLWYLDRVRESWDYYNMAIKLDPANATAWRSRGEVYEALGDNKSAKHDYDKADKLEAE